MRFARSANVAAVALALASLATAAFASIFRESSLCVGLPTLFCGIVWARLRTEVRYALPLAMLVAATSGSIAAAIAPAAGPFASLAGALRGVTLGVVYWAPALALAIVLFAWPAHHAALLARSSRADAALGQGIVGMSAAVLGMAGFVASLMSESSLNLGARALTWTFGVGSLVTGAIAALSATRATWRSPASPPARYVHR